MLIFLKSPIIRYNKVIERVLVVAIIDGISKIIKCLVLIIDSQ